MFDVMQYQILVLFRSCYGQSRLWEFQAVAERAHPTVDFHWQWEETCHQYYGGSYGSSIVQSVSDDLTVEQWADIGAQCIGCKAIFEVIGEGKTLRDCVEHVGRLRDEQILELIPRTWSMQIKHLGKIRRLHPKERREHIETFRDVLGALTKRRVDLENPDSELWLLKDCRSLEDNDSSTERQITLHHWLLKCVKPKIPISATELSIRSDVKKRAFISTTTMPSDRAILMSNLGRVGNGTTVLDPFCGSGGLLVSSALLGANVVGADVDVGVLSFTDKPLPFPNSPHRPNRGLEKVSYVDSFTELGLDKPTLLPGLDIQSLDFVACVLAANHGQKYDAIVTDPPYGIRESQSQMTTLNIVERLCMVGKEILRTNARMVFLEVIEGRLTEVDDIRQLLHSRIKTTVEQHGFEIVALSLEKFNMRHLRATIVVEFKERTFF
jgi:tRNA G10  N-methylase Trm11